MRDGDDHDDGFPNEISKGKIIHSGITPENIGPADYALGEGVPALMEELQTRRAWILGTVGMALAAGTTGAMLAGMFGGAGPDQANEDAEPDSGLTREEQLWIEGARSFANGDLDKLVGAYRPFIRVIELYGADETLWRGAERLASYALLKKTDPAPHIARRLLQAFELRPPPKELRRLIPDLKRLVLGRSG